MKEPKRNALADAAKTYDLEDERGANQTAQIAIAAASVIYLGIFIMVLLDLTRFSLLNFLALFAFFAAAVLINIALYPVVRKRAPWLRKYLLIGVIFVACISVQASTQLLGALFLAFPILLACRYHDRNFMISVIGASFLSVLAKELLCWKIGTYDLNVVSLVDNVLIADGRYFQSSVMPYINMQTYLRDVLLFSVLPQWVQLLIITVVAGLLGNNGRALRNHQREAIRREAAVESELDNAREIQMGLLPEDFRFGDGVDLFASSVPAKNVGGDFYDCFMLDSHHIAIVIADVSGKGMPAALFMATTKMCIRDYASVGLKAEEVFTRVNSSICENNKKGMFVTAWLGILDLSTGVLDYVNAGHNPPLVRGRDGVFKFLAMKTNLILGAYESYTYRGERLVMAPGDAIVLYTDGVTESRTEAAELFGNDRLARLLNRQGGLTGAEIVKAVNDGVNRFAGACEQYDDITVLALNYRGLAESMQRETFPAQLEEYPAVKEFVDRALRQLGAEDKTVHRFLVAADELFTNVAKYAYPNRDGTVELRVTGANGKLSLTLLDSGIPFNPLTKKQESAFPETGERRLGGLGITVVKSMMDEVTYSYVENKNIVTVSHTPAERA